MEKNTLLNIGVCIWEPEPFFYNKAGQKIFDYAVHRIHNKTQFDKWF